MKAYYLTFFILIIAYDVTASKSDHNLSSFQSGYINPSMRQNTSFLIKRRSHSDKKNKRRDCKNRVCSLVLKACPKACPQSCGYLNSPDPCCPLLGKPTCPDY